MKAAGVDGVEIHSAHGCLLNQFYSMLLNLSMDIARLMTRTRQEEGGVFDND